MLSIQLPIWPNIQPLKNNGAPWSWRPGGPGGPAAQKAQALHGEFRATSAAAGRSGGAVAAVAAGPVQLKGKTHGFL